MWPLRFVDRLSSAGLPSAAAEGSFSQIGRQALQLQIRPDLDELGNKFVTADDSIEFHLHKSQSAPAGGQYLWEISDHQNVQTVTVIYDGSSAMVELHDTGQDEVTTVDLCRSSYYTVTKFSFRNTQYRWAMTRADASKSETDLRIELLECNSAQCLASIAGPGFQRKKYWVQQPVSDMISVFADCDRNWLHMIVTTGLVAAKTQRHRDKVTTMARKRGTGFV